MYKVITSEVRKTEGFILTFKFAVKSEISNFHTSDFINLEVLNLFNTRNSVFSQKL